MPWNVGKAQLGKGQLVAGLLKGQQLNRGKGQEVESDANPQPWNHGKGQVDRSDVKGQQRNPGKGLPVRLNVNAQQWSHGKGQEDQSDVNAQQWNQGKGKVVSSVANAQQWNKGRAPLRIDVKASQWNQGKAQEVQSDVNAQQWSHGKAQEARSDVGAQKGKQGRGLMLRSVLNSQAAQPWSQGKAQDAPADDGAQQWNHGRGQMVPSDVNAQSWSHGEGDQTLAFGDMDSSDANAQQWSQGGGGQMVQSHFNAHPRMHGKGSDAWGDVNTQQRHFGKGQEVRSDVNAQQWNQGKGQEVRNDATGFKTWSDGKGHESWSDEPAPEPRNDGKGQEAWSDSNAWSKNDGTGQEAWSASNSWSQKKSTESWNDGQGQQSWTDGKRDAWADGKGKEASKGKGRQLWSVVKQEMRSDGKGRDHWGKRAAGDDGKGRAAFLRAKTESSQESQESAPSGSALDNALAAALAGLKPQAMQSLAAQFPGTLPGELPPGPPTLAGLHPAMPGTMRAFSGSSKDQVLQPSMFKVGSDNAMAELEEKEKEEAAAPQSFPWEGTSGIICRFGRNCKNTNCKDVHPEGRLMEEAPAGTLCRFGRRCKRLSCFYSHPHGRDIDDDPSKATCKWGKECPRRDCLYNHPDGRIIDDEETRRCLRCGREGHLARDCPEKQGQVVITSRFPKAWELLGQDAVVARVVEELEVFGELIGKPIVRDGGSKVTALFADPVLGRAAAHTLQGHIFNIKLEEPRRSPGDPAWLNLRGFPKSWAASQVATLLRGLVKSSALDVSLVAEGVAKVRFADEVGADRAMMDLEGQKVVGKPLQVQRMDPAAASAAPAFENPPPSPFESVKKEIKKEPEFTMFSMVKEEPPSASSKLAKAVPVSFGLATEEPSSSNEIKALALLDDSSSQTKEVPTSSSPTKEVPLSSRQAAASLFKSVAASSSISMVKEEPMEVPFNVVAPTSEDKRAKAEAAQQLPLPAQQLPLPAEELPPGQHLPLPAQQFALPSPEGAPMSVVEQELATAVMDFVKTWAVRNPDGRQPNLVHVGADPKVRQCKNAAIPREVALRVWLEDRLKHLITICKDERGMTVVQLASERRPGEEPPRKRRKGRRVKLESVESG